MNDTKETQGAHAELRTRILDTAMHDFIHQGIKDTKVDVIAASLGISKRTLYELFEDKENLVLACLSHFFDTRSIRFRQIARHSTNVLEVILNIYLLKAEDLRVTNTHFYNDISKYPSVVSFLHVRQ